MYADINSEIAQYKEQVLYGLNLQQVIIAGAALATEVGAFFLFQYRYKLDDFICTLIYVFVAIPFGAAFVVKYNNMSFSKLCKVWLKYYFFQDKHLVFMNNNYWHKLISVKKGDIK